jgi:hypothetical protein|tara:strand:- start:56 stop:340 length:285 start_codon:yes stop_codon:yes gene_type:complete
LSEATALQNEFFCENTVIHPLELLDRWRRHLPGSRRWRRDSAAAATPPDQDWLREPATLEEASALYPHLSQEQAMVRYQRFRLGMRWQRDQELS